VNAAALNSVAKPAEWINPHALKSIVSGNSPAGRAWRTCPKTRPKQASRWFGGLSIKELTIDARVKLIHVHGAFRVVSV
jgi:hypothetical protein